MTNHIRHIFPGLIIKLSPILGREVERSFLFLFLLFFSFFNQNGILTNKLRTMVIHAHSCVLTMHTSLRTIIRHCIQFLYNITEKNRKHSATRFLKKITQSVMFRYSQIYTTSFLTVTIKNDARSLKKPLTS